MTSSSVSSSPISGEGLVLAVDVGNSKTHVVVAERDGRIRGAARGPGLLSGLGTGERLVEQLLDLAEAACGQRSGFAAASLALAGVDIPEQEEAMTRMVDAASVADRVTVLNDTFALLRTSSVSGDGVAVVAGAGINCVGVREGRHVRYHAMGSWSGDWGGGHDLGREALSVACRAEDGRGAATALTERVPRHFGLSRPLEVTEKLMLEQLSDHRLIELARVVLDTASDGDPVAVGLVERLADEVVLLVENTRRRLDWPEGSEPLRVLLGGGLLQSGNAVLLDRIHARLDASRTTISVASMAPVVGSLLLAFDLLDDPHTHPDPDDLAASVATALLPH